MPVDDLHGKNVLVLGAYGFIGAAVVHALTLNGATVRGLVRSHSTGYKVLPDLDLVQGDLRLLTQPEDWKPILQSTDAVINCAGALQDGGQDDLELVHHTAIAALGQTCARENVAAIQISAVGAEVDAQSRFLSTKAAGDQALRATVAQLWVLKPGLVIDQTDYGGTALLRMLAAVPWVQPLAYPNTPVQCVGMPDVCSAVLSAVAGRLPQGTYDLVEDAPQPLSDVVAATRRWLRFRPALMGLTLPPMLVRRITAVADLLGRVGWRSPLRSTAMEVMAQGVTGNPAPYRTVSGHTMMPLPQVYANLSCGREHRLAARVSLLMPLVIGVLSLFWVLSGLFGLLGVSTASQVLIGAGWAGPLSTVSVLVWSLVDIALGLAILWRSWAVRACMAQVGVALLYLVSASLLVPELWSDPLGPLVKVLPAMTLSLTAIPMLERR